MAFERINEYTDSLAEMYLKAENRGNCAQSYAILQALIAYGETVLATKKFKFQRLYWKETIERINPAYAFGYFGKSAKVKSRIAQINIGSN